MPILVVGLSHNSVPIDLLERVRIHSDRLSDELEKLADLPNVDEAALLSTCNRMEVYAAAEKFHLGYEPIKGYLSGLAEEESSDFCYSYYEIEAVNHLFSVVSGLQSAVLGEREIQGQVRSAWRAAVKMGTSSKQLDELFSHALSVGRQVRFKTKLGSGISSVPHVAAAMAASALGGLERQQIVVLGSGEMGSALVEMLPPPPTSEVVIASRNWGRARSLASSSGYRAVPLEDLSSELVKADLVFTSTGARSPVLLRADLSKVMEDRAGRPLLIVDICVPRGVEPSASELDGITLWNMDDVREFSEDITPAGTEMLGRANEILSAELDKYRERAASRLLTPLIDEFRRHICDISQGEFERFGTKLSSLNAQQRATVEALVHGIVNKVLHEPTVRLRGAASDDGGEYLGEALRELFDL